MVISSSVSTKIDIDIKHPRKEGDEAFSLANSYNTNFCHVQVTFKGQRIRKQQENEINKETGQYSYTQKSVLTSKATNFHLSRDVTYQTFHQFFSYDIMSNKN